MSRKPFDMPKPEPHEKVTWEEIVEDFKIRMPSCRKLVAGWEGCDYATVRVFLHDGRILRYNYDTHKIIIDSWKWGKKYR